MTDYTAVYNIPAIKRGDTMDPFLITIKDKFGEVIIPSNVCCQVRDSRGKLVITLPTEVDSSTGGIKVGGLHAQVTSTIKAGEYNYDVEFTSPEGRVRTYLEGTFPIIEDVSRCQ